MSTPEGQVIKLDAPTTLVLRPETISMILDSLAERPWRQAQPAINEILTQLQASQAKPLVQPPAPVPPLGDTVQ